MSHPQHLRTRSAPRAEQHRIDAVVDRITADLPRDDPRVGLVPSCVADAADQLAAAPVRTYIPVLVERAARRALGEPHAVTRARWRRRTPCELRLRKWDGSPGRRTPLRPLHQDTFGRWYLWPAGEAMLPRSGPPRTFAHPFVHLVPTSGSWTARWGDDGEVGLYCDVTTPPVVRSDTVTAVDLDLDVVRYRDGRVAIIDQEQFARRRIQMGYPLRVVTDAVVTASRLYDAVTSGHEPFATVGADVLARHT